MAGEDIAAEVVVARIHGCSYPPQIREDELLGKHFIESCHLSVGDRILLRQPEWESESPRLFSHVVEPIAPFPYIVRSIKLAVSDRSADHGQFSPSRTKVFLSGEPCSCEDASSQIEAYLETRPKDLPPIVTLPVPSRSGIMEEFIAVRSENLSASLPDYRAACEARFANTLVARLHQALAPRFSPKFASIAQQLSRDCLMVDIETTPFSQEDVHVALQHCADHLSVPLHSVDARLLVLNASKLSQLPLFRPSHCLDSIRADEVLPLAPCLLYVHNIDLLAESSANRDAHPQENLEDDIAVHLTKLAEASVSWTSRAGPPSPLPVLALVASSAVWSRLRPALKAVFAMTVRCSTSEGLDASLAGTIRCFEERVQCTPEAFQELEKSLFKQPRGGIQRYEIVRQAASHRLRLQCDPCTLSSVSPSGLGWPTDGSSSLSLQTADIQAALRVDQALTRSTTHTMSQARTHPVRWSDIGGLDRVRKEILDVLELPLQQPELFPAGIPRRQGVLLYGPPGTGKTLVAKAVATECKLAFLSVKGPELLDSYVGESEKNVRELFAQARRLSPCVLFFDEIDSLAPARAQGQDSGGGVMDRIVAQLLTEIDLLAGAGQSAGGNAQSASSPPFVFLIAATNRPDLLDPALLRPRRLDRKIYLGVCRDRAARVAILRAQCRTFQLSEEVDLEAVEACLPEYVTGADIGAVTRQAYRMALQRTMQAIRTQALQEAEQTGQRALTEGDEQEILAIVRTYQEECSMDCLQVIVHQDDLVQAARCCRATPVDWEYYDQLERTFGDPPQPVPSRNKGNGE